MKTSILGLFLLLAGVQWSGAQSKADNTSTRCYTKAEQEMINLSKTKWQWMSDKNVDSLNVLFDNKSMFVHMGGSWGKDEEINVIKSGGIRYKKAEVYSTSVNAGYGAGSTSKL